MDVHADDGGSYRDVEYKLELLVSCPSNEFLPSNGSSTVARTVKRVDSVSGPCGFTLLVLKGTVVLATQFGGCDAYDGDKSDRFVDAPNLYIVKDKHAAQLRPGAHIYGTFGLHEAENIPAQD
ncbi:hypothetical protein N7522_004198 [Penicillium canescens]|nr:hypothetical protein N7522_004198 [Penicillium canescens]